VFRIFDWSHWSALEGIAGKVSGAWLFNGTWVSTRLSQRSGPGFASKKNGDLIRSAQISGYQVLPTSDQGIPYQQSSEGREIAIVILRARTNQLADLLPLADLILRSLETMKRSSRGQTVLIGIRYTTWVWLN
jgi:hypothetical protein